MEYIHEIARKERLEHFKQFQKSRKLMTVEEYNKIGFCDPEYHNGNVYVYDNIFHIEIKENSFHLLVDRDEYKAESIDELEELEWNLFEWALDFA
jgi:hypothetical protein